MNASVLYMEFTGQISQLNDQIRDHEEKIRRLQAALRNIEADQKDLIQKKELINQPELSDQTWKGKHANQFQDIKEKIETEYKELSGLDTNAILDEIENKITYYQNLIDTLQNSISNINVKINNIKEE